MGEPFSVADGFVSVTVPALHDIRLLLDDLRNIKNAPYTVQRLRDDVRSVDLSLASLGEVKEQDLEVLGASVAEEAKTAIGSCAKACKQFRDDLQNWTWHSDDGTLRWQDRANVGFFKQAEIRAVSEQLQNCKLVITSVVSVATLYSSARNTQITEKTKRTIYARQVEIKTAIEAADDRLAAFESRVEELQLAPSEGQTDGSISSAQVLRQLEEERKAATATRKLLDELLAMTQEEAVTNACVKHQSGGSITVNFGDNNSGFQAGRIDGGVSRISFGGSGAYH